MLEQERSNTREFFPIVSEVYMNYTKLEIDNERISKLFEFCRKDIDSWGLKFPIVSKSNPKYNIDFSNKLPKDDAFMYSKIGFEVVEDEVIDLSIDISKQIEIKVKVGNQIVRNGFFVKDLYLGLVGAEKFTLENFAKTLSYEDSIFVSYGIAFLKAGIIVYVPGDLNVKFNIKRNIKDSFFGGFYTMFYIGDNTNVEFFEDVVSEGDDGKFAFEVSEVIIGNNSNVRYNSLHNVDLSSDYFFTRKLTTKGNNNIEINDVLLGASYERIDEKIFMEGRNVETKYTGIYFTKFNQKYDFIVNARHRGLDQGADVIVKGVLDDKSKVYFNGILKVDEKLKGINSFLGGHSLHLSSECKSDSIPSLEIDSFDVKSGHAASLTQMDEEKLFYMMSKGFSEEEAKKLMVRGFIEGALNRISNEEFRKKVKFYMKEKGLEIIDLEFDYTV